MLITTIKFFYTEMLRFLLEIDKKKIQNRREKQQRNTEFFSSSFELVQVE